MGIDLTSANFEKEVLQSDLPVLIDFWAPWCGPCKLVAPIVAEIANEYAGRIKVGKLNVDENNDIAMRYMVMSIPTLKLFKKGQVVGDYVGAAPKQLIADFINKQL